MKLDTNAVIIPHFCFLGTSGNIRSISFFKKLCAVLLYDLLVYYNKLQRFNLFAKCNEI